MKTTDKFVLFWNGIYSNWEPSPFVWNGMEFNCGEQYMMCHKAKMFEDWGTLLRIMETSDPGTQKKLGRTVKGFDQAKWEEKCIDIMVEGLLCKFEQNPKMKEELLATGDRIIAEASPVDKIWGIGLAENDSRCLDVNTWQGKNYLGVVLMKVRELLKEKSNEL